MSTQDVTSNAELQAQVQAESISLMLEAISFDYDEHQARINAVEWAKEEHDAYLLSALESKETTTQEHLEKVNELHRAWREAEGELEDNPKPFNDINSRDEAIDRLLEDALEVCYRSDWATYGDTLEPSEFYILLCTGGPAVRIRGDLDEVGYPTRAYMEYQDWGTPWTHYSGASHSMLLEYAGYYLGGF